MYLIGRDVELTEERISKILSQFTTKELPKLRRYENYYAGKQAIMAKIPSDEGKPCNHIVANYCYSTVQSYLGYIAGIPIHYDNEKFAEVLDILKYNDVVDEDSLLLKNALVYGVSYEINYVDEDGRQRFKVLDSKECIPVYDNTLSGDLLYVIRFYREDLVENSQESYLVDVYGEKTVKHYRSGMGFSSVSLLGEEFHFYDQVPVTVFDLNSDKDSIFAQIMSLQDAYNELLSSEVDDFQAFADAYLVLKGVTADSDELSTMKEHRALVMDTDASAEYLTKSISDTQIANMLTNINDQIHTISNAPDFNDERFMASSGIAMRYKLVGFENQASSIEANMRKALQKRIELISEITALKTGESTWRDVEITFTRNLPMNLDEVVQVVNSLQGIVSNRTLLGLLPFVTDVEQELKDIEEQKTKNMELYSFPATEVTENDERRVD